MAGHASHIHGHVNGHLNYSNFQPKRSLLKLLPLDDPLRQSPLYFQSGEASTATPTRRSPLSGLGRPQANHSHWAPANDKAYRRSLPPPDLSFHQLSTSHYTVQDSNRRRSLPPNARSPEQHQIHSKSSGSPPLWSVAEDDQYAHEPMDISPVKPHRSPPRPTADTTSSSVTFPRSEKNILPPQVRRETSFLQQRADSKPFEQGTKSQPFRIRKLGDKASERSSKSELKFSVCRFVILTMIFQFALGAGALVLSMIGFDMHRFWCQHHLKLNTTLLSESLESQVYGQHIAVDTIPKLFDTYLESSDSQNKKPLVMSFHGWTGVGKNHISFIIGEHLRRGTANKIICPHHFPHRDENYTEMLRNMIMTKFSACTLNLFVIDEIDKAPDNIIHGLYNILREIRSPEYEIYLDNANVVILMLSNTGATQINSKVLEALYNEERPRETITLQELNGVMLAPENYESKQFTWFRTLHKEGLIDAVIPFLPLEKKHVKLCIIRHMKDKGLVPTDKYVNEVVEQMAFFPHVPLFSKWGCRKVPAKVDLTGI